MCLERYDEIKFDPEQEDGKEGKDVGPKGECTKKGKVQNGKLLKKLGTQPSYYKKSTWL